MVKRLFCVHMLGLAVGGNFMFWSVVLIIGIVDFYCHLCA